MLGTRTLESAFALMHQASRRAGETGDYNDFIRALPVPPIVPGDYNFNKDNHNLVTMTKFLTYVYTSKPGNSLK